MAVTNAKRIALVGGTGNQGPSLALRWALAGHHVSIGSRSLEKAGQTVTELMNRNDIKLEGEIQSGLNADIVTEADIIVLTLPFRALSGTLSELKNCILPNTIVVSPVSSLKPVNKELVPDPVPAGSAAEFIAQSLPQTLIVSAFHTVAARRLADVSKSVVGDVPVCSDHEEAKRTVMDLILDIPNMSAFDAGSLKTSRIVEEFASVVINLGRRVKKPDIGIKFE